MVAPRLRIRGGGCRADHAFDTLGKPRVVSLIRPENTPSQGVAIKIGMTLVGEADHAGPRI